MGNPVIFAVGLGLAVQMAFGATYAENVDPAVYGFSPDAAPDVNAKALQMGYDYEG